MTAPLTIDPGVLAHLEKAGDVEKTRQQVDSYYRRLLILQDVAGASLEASESNARTLAAGAVPVARLARLTEQAVYQLRSELVVGLDVFREGVPLHHPNRLELLAIADEIEAESRI